MGGRQRGETLLVTVEGGGRLELLVTPTQVSRSRIGSRSRIRSRSRSRNRRRSRRRSRSKRRSNAPVQDLRVVPGHSSLLGRSLQGLRVGGGWDAKEKVFRNSLGAFQPNSSLHMLASLGAATTSARMVQVEGQE